MIAPEVRRELDKLQRRIETLERERRGAVSEKDVENIAKKQVESLRPELDALKRRAG